VHPALVSIGVIGIIGNIRLESCPLWFLCQQTIGRSRLIAAKRPRRRSPEYRDQSRPYVVTVAEKMLSHRLYRLWWIPHVSSPSAIDGATNALGFDGSEAA
jgi:hypothetical protein